MKLNYLLLLALQIILFTACDSKEERVRLLVMDYLKSNEIAVEKYEIEQSTISPAKQTALNDSAIWSLVSEYVLEIQLTDLEAQREYAEPSIQESMLNVGIIRINEYVDSINNRVSQLDSTKTLGYEFIQKGQIVMPNNNVQDVKFRIITDQDVSKILLCVPLMDESERIIKIIEEAQHGNLTKLPIDPQKEMMYYWAMGRQKPSF